MASKWLGDYVINQICIKVVVGSNMLVCVREGGREGVDKNERWTSCQKKPLAGVATKVLPCFHGHHFIHKNILATRGS